MAQAPVQFTLPVGIGGSHPPALFLVPLRVGFDGFARRAGADEIQEKTALRIRAHLQAALKDLPAGGFGSQGDRFGVVDGIGQGRFAINMFARLQGGDSDVAVLVRRRGNMTAWVSLSS